MNNKNNVWIMDVETLSNCFTYSAINRDSDEIVSFVIWKDRNDLNELLNHLWECKGQIGFNNIAFDANIIQFILRSKNKLKKLDGDEIARRIYQEAQNTIQAEWSDIRNPIIPQLDVFRIHHFDNKAKICSLKKIEIALGFENVQDMPIHHTEEIKTNEQVEEILAYNINDIKATKVFYEKTLDKIELRKGLLKKYGLPCINYSDSKIGSELMLKLYCEATNKDINSVRKQRTIRNNYKFKDHIFDYIKFETNEFNGLLDYLKGIEVKELKDSFSYQFDYSGIKYFYGVGGLHSCAKEGVYESDKENIIVDIDVTGFYPHLAVRNEFYPEHLGKEFCEVYENEILIPRVLAKKSGDKVIANGFKLSANSCFGNYNNQYSWLQDGYCLVRTTLNGQLSLSMLIEMMHIKIDGIKLLQANTK